MFNSSAASWATASTWSRPKPRKEPQKSYSTCWPREWARGKSVWPRTTKRKHLKSGSTRATKPKRPSLECVRCTERGGLGMSKPVKRRCPQCGKVKSFRADCKTCGCPRPGAAPKVDPLEGKYFVDPNGQADGKIIARVSGSQYLVGLGGNDGDVEQLLP